MPVFLNRRYPYFRIINPATLSAAEFKGGKLEIDVDHPDYWAVAAEAERNPDIVVVTNLVQCELCGEQFTGKMANADLGKHRKAIHPLEWDADQEAAHAEARNVIIQQRSGIACDACPPGTQVFGSEDELNLHTRFIHAAPVEASQVGVPIPDEIRDQLGGDSPPPEG